MITFIRCQFLGSRFGVWIDQFCGNLAFIAFIYFLEEDGCSVVAGISEGVGARAAAMGVISKLPVPKKVSHVLETHGDKREDNYYWIRDDERKNPEVLAYLEEENNYTEAVMAGEILWIIPNCIVLYMSFWRCSLLVGFTGMSDHLLNVGSV